MILVFDTETTTFPSSTLPANHPSQARIVQLAWLLFDESFQERSCFNSLIKIPSSVRISEGATKAHGISEEDCAKWGMDIGPTIELLINTFRNSGIIVAHNAPFDIQMINIEHELLFGDKLTGALSSFCTMRSMASLCKLPFKNGRASYGGQKYKWPTLQEAHQHCFGEKFEGAHDALADVRATARIYRWLKEHEFGDSSAQAEIIADYTPDNAPLKTKIA